MTMMHFLDSDRDHLELEVTANPATISENLSLSVSPDAKFHIFDDKITIPKHQNVISRPRLLSLIGKTASMFPAIALIGRTGTGKTVLAAEFAKTYSNPERTVWLTVGPTESGWPMFSAYFQAAFSPACQYKPLLHTANRRCTAPKQDEIENFLLPLFYEPAGSPQLIVLDDLHYIFDAPWFCDFLTILIAMLPDDCRLMLLSRSKPPGPVWRLRSKQLLGVIDEKRLSLSRLEAAELLKRFGSPDSASNSISRCESIRIARVIGIINAFITQ